MNWISLEAESQLAEIISRSNEKDQLIFKHSTRCSASSLALARMERQSRPNTFDFYLLDLIRYRELSNQVAESFQVPHESPQVLLIRDAVCIYDESHTGINMAEIIAASHNRSLL